MAGISMPLFSKGNFRRAATMRWQAGAACTQRAFIGMSL